MEKKIADMVIIPVFLAFILLASSPATADSTYWTGTTGDWHDPLNWDNGIPTSPDWTYIDNGGTAQISPDAESRYLYDGRYNSGAVEQTGGTNSVGSSLYLGYYSGSSGTYNLSGTAQLSVGYSEYIGYYGTGEFNQTSGIHTASGTLDLAYESGSSGTYNLSGTAQLSVAYSEYIGQSGTGEFNQTGGIHTVNSTLFLGCVSGSSGTYNLSGTAQLSAAFETIGMGELNQDGGINTINCSLHLGRYSGSIGTYNLSAGELSADSEYICFDGTGEFNQTGGTNTVSSHLYLGLSSGSSGTYNLSEGKLFVGPIEHIGFYGTGEFNQTGGTHTVSGTLHLGDLSGSSGTYNLSGGSLETGNLDIDYGWMDIDVSEIDLFAVSSDRVSLLDGYIAEDKIIDSTLSADQYLYAVYDSENGWTTLDVGFIPEPSTLLLLAPGLLGFAGVLRRRLR